MFSSFGIVFDNVVSTWFFYLQTRFYSQQMHPDGHFLVMHTEFVFFHQTYLHESKIHLDISGRNESDHRPKALL